MRGEAASYATFVLNGKLSVLAGVDGFRAEAGPWTVLGADALVSDEGSFVPDFSAHVATDSVRCVHVTRAEYERAITGRRRRGRRGMGTDGEESDTGRRARLGRRGEMAEKRRRLARMAGQNRARARRRAALDQFRGEQTGAMSDGERPWRAARGEESGASSQAPRRAGRGLRLGPQLGSSREDLLANATSGNESGSDVGLMCVWFWGVALLIKLSVEFY